MYNWSTDTKKLRQHSKKFTIWKLENLINFGLNDSKINAAELKENLPNLDIDDKKRNFLNFLLK